VCDAFVSEFKGVVCSYFLHAAIPFEGVIRPVYDMSQRIIVFALDYVIESFEMDHTFVV